MAASGEKNGDFYSVLGLKKECSDAELRNAYKKLALRWHPDRCSATGTSEFVKEAKEKFQAIQEAYSILSDSNKRFLYDVGVYESDDDDDDNGMGDFLDEMVQIMSQTKSNEKGQDSFEDLQKMFMDMFEADLNLSGLASGTVPAAKTAAAASSSNGYCNAGTAECGSGGKRRGSVLASAAGKAKLQEFDGGSAGFCFGSNEGTQSSDGGRGGNRRNGRKQKTSSKHDLSSMDAEIST
uniref:Chaperone protein DnaJ isoform X4 n=1 Tax=Cymbidium ensifolium TaxID=78740 RepID=A0A5B9MQF6_CYMEN|nr:chaperone protein DnaJ isoform X4 [Cymbidium ensifolium]